MIRFSQILFIGFFFLNLLGGTVQGLGISAGEGKASAYDRRYYYRPYYSKYRGYKYYYTYPRYQYYYHDPYYYYYERAPGIYFYYRA
ncbi:MAG: hypothetical protein ACSNEK_05150 [Parachlamydiaceae bacterium]